MFENSSVIYEVRVACPVCTYSRSKTPCVASVDNLINKTISNATTKIHSLNNLVTESKYNKQLERETILLKFSLSKCVLLKSF